jgi:cytochrome c oxidase subunit 1/cytochrome c oxidase subunit I+III
MKMPEDTISPLLVALTLMLLFLALIFQWMWVALAGVVGTLFAGYYWLWPTPQEEPQEKLEVELV